MLALARIESRPILHPPLHHHSIPSFCHNSIPSFLHHSIPPPPHAAHALPWTATYLHVVVVHVVGRVSVQVVHDHLIGVQSCEQRVGSLVRVRDTTEGGGGEEKLTFNLCTLQNITGYFVSKLKVHRKMVGLPGEFQR